MKRRRPRSTGVFAEVICGEVLFKRTNAIARNAARRNIHGAGKMLFTLAPSGQRREMVVGTGFEPVERFLQACVAFAASVSAESDDTQLRTQKLAELREVIEAWPKLSAELRAAVRAVTGAVTK